MGNIRSWLPRLVPGLRVRLLILVVLACAPLVALTLNSSWEDRRRARSGWRQRVSRLAQLANREEEKVIGTTRQLLAAVAESSPVRAGNSRACQRLMDHLYGSYPRYANLGVVSTNGTLIAAAVPLPEGEDLSHRKFFVRAMQNRGVSIGDWQDGVTNQLPPTITFALPVMKSGQPLVVVFATLDLDWYSRFGSELPAQLPAAATWTVATPQGEVLLQHRGRDTKELHAFPVDRIPDIFKENRGLLEYTDKAGVPYVAAFAVFRTRLGGGRNVAILSVPRETLFAEADRALTRNLLWLGSAVVMAAIIGWIGSRILVLRPVRAVVDSSTRLAQGDLSARIGLPYGSDELGSLTRAFDRMAQALEQREVDRQKANHKLQVLSRRLVEVQESERRHLARELHDEIGQALTAADLNLRATIDTPGSTLLLPRLTASSEMIRDVLEKVQDISLNLRPSMLDDLGLESAIRWYTNRQAELAGLEAEFLSDPLERRLDPVIETECFRVAQEALTNVARHARAHAVSVHLNARSKHLHLLVKDDGVGFDVAALRDQAIRGESLGLLSMEERAVLAGGGLEFCSSPGTGTEIRAWFPLRWRDDTTI